MRDSAGRGIFYSEGHMTWKKFVIYTFCALAVFALVVVIAALVPNNNQTVVAGKIEPALVPVTGNPEHITHLASPKSRAMRGDVNALKKTFRDLWNVHEK